MDPQPLSGGGDLSLDSDELGINATLDEVTKGSKLSEENIDFAGHQHCSLCSLVGVDAGQEHSWCLLWVPSDCNLQYESGYGLDTKWALCIHDWLWTK